MASCWSLGTSKLHRQLVCFHFVETLAVMLVVPLLPSMAEALGISRRQAGYATSVYSSVQFVSTPLVGMASDKLEKLNVLVWSFALVAMSYTLLGWAMAAVLSQEEVQANAQGDSTLVENTSVRFTVWMFLLSRVFTGCVKHSNLIKKAIASDPELTKDEDRASVLGMFYASGSVGSSIGPSLGGVLAENYGLSVCCFASAAILLLVSGVGRVVLVVQNETTKENVDTAEIDKTKGVVESTEDTSLVSKIGATGISSKLIVCNMDTATQSADSTTRKSNNTDNAVRQSNITDNAVHQSNNTDNAVRQSNNTNNMLHSNTIQSTQFLSKSVWLLMFVRVVVGFAVSLFFSSYRYLVQDKFSLGLRGAGFIGGIFNGCGVFTQTVLVSKLRLWFKDKQIAIYAALMLGVGAIALSRSYSMISCIVAIVCISVSSDVLRVTFWLLLSAAATKSHDGIGRVVGIAQSMFSVAAITGPTVSGILCEADASYPVQLAGLLCFVVAFMLHHFVSNDVLETKEKPKME